MPGDVPDRLPSGGLAVAVVAARAALAALMARAPSRRRRRCRRWWTTRAGSARAGVSRRCPTRSRPSRATAQRPWTGAGRCASKPRRPTATWCTRCPACRRHARCAGLAPAAAQRAVDLRRKAGDDAPAKVCLSFRLATCSRALRRTAAAAPGTLAQQRGLACGDAVLVWAGAEERGALIDNAYSRRVRFIVLRNGSDAQAPGCRKAATSPPTFCVPSATRVRRCRR